MSTITETRESLPVGTWSLDPVHSQIGFAVDYVVGTFRGSFSPVEAKLDVGEDGALSLMETLVGHSLVHLVRLILGRGSEC